MIYDQEHTHRADREVIAKDMGYAGLNGASAAAIASLRQYGLLERSGDGMKVTEDATTILELPAEEAERVAALKRVAFAPPLFAELTENFGTNLPSDENLRLFLVKRGFNKGAANNLIRTLRETLSLVKEEGRGYDGEESTETESYEASRTMPSLSSQQVSAFQRPATASPSVAITEDANWRLTDTCKVRVLFEGNVTREAITKLVEYLNLGKDAYPKSATEEKKEGNKEEGELR
jgi:hypothetical protein